MALSGALRAQGQLFDTAVVIELAARSPPGTFRAKHATANAGALYTAKRTAALLVPLASVLAQHHDWNSVFLIAACLSIAAALLSAALLSMFVLKPMRQRWIAHAGALPLAAVAAA